MRTKSHVPLGVYLSIVGGTLFAIKGNNENLCGQQINNCIVKKSIFS